MRALSALGVAPENPTFPAVVTCPACQQNTLNLFDDVVTDGIWLNCQACQIHGNIITFAGQIWNIGLPATLSKLNALDLISGDDQQRAIGEYEREQAKAQAAENFWQESVGQIWNHGHDITACRLRELGVQHEVEACRGLVGVAHQDQIAELCAELGRAKTIASKSRSPSVVFPYYDLPNRLTGFLLMQYDEDFACRRTFVPVIFRQKKTDAGYFLLHTAFLPPTELLKNKQFIIDDPTWALAAQCRRLKYGMGLLPLMAGYCGPEAVSFGLNWPSFYPTQRFFQGQVSTPELLSQACFGKGYVCVTGLDHKRVLNTPQYTLSRLAAIHSAAEPWKANLLRTLTSSNEMTAFAFASRLRVPQDTLNSFFTRFSDRFSPGFGQRVFDAMQHTTSEPARVKHRWVIAEKDNQWWTHNGQRICNARPTVTKIIQLDDGSQMYAGTVHLNDAVFEFIDNAKTIERMGLLAYVASQMAQIGKLVAFDRHWNGKSLVLAMQLHEPKLELVSSRIGWDETANVFRFGNYALAATGAVTPTPSLPNRRAPISFPEPALVAPLGIRTFLTPTAHNAFVWNVFAGIVADLLAPALNRDPSSVVITGSAFPLAAKLGAALHCRHAQSSAMHARETANFVTAQLKKADWPLFISHAFNNGIFGKIIAKQHNDALFVRMDETGAALAPGYGWHCIHGPDDVPPDLDLSVFQHVLPAYMQRLLRLRLNLVTQNKNLLVGIVKDLHTWLQETYDATVNLPQALSQLATPADAHKTLMQEINRALEAGKILLLPRPRRPDQPSSYLLRRKDHWWINRRAVDNYLHDNKNIPPNWLAIIDLLVSAGVFGGDEVVQRMPGFLVNASWCEQFLAAPDLSTREIG